MINYVAACLLGIISGIVTGLIPGIHPNTLIFSSLPIYLSTSIGQGIYVSYVTGLSVSHTFHDFLPAIFLSTPDAEAALSVVAAPEMVEKGKGLEAFLYTVRGGLNSILVIGVIAVPLYFFMQSIYTSISGFMHYILIFFLLYIVLNSEELKASLLVTVFSGALGIIAFQSNINQQFVLVPIFSGLFAVPGIASMLGENFQIPEQNAPEESLLSFSRSGVAGTLAGLLAGTIPGIGAAVSTSFMTPLMEESKKSFLTAMGAVNTSDIIFSLISLALIGRARSGVSVALQAISQPSTSQIIAFMLLSVFSVLVSVPVALKVAGRYQELLQRFELGKVLYAVLATVLLATLSLTGAGGLLLLLVSSCIGMAAMRYDERKACMAVLIVPSILSFAGIAIFM